MSTRYAGVVPLNYAELHRFKRNYRIAHEPNPITGTPCWVWIGRHWFPNGYGAHRTGPGKGARPAHVIAYEHHVGPVPDGLQLDHRCRNRACVNPDHLEPVTGSVNTLRQDHAGRRKTHCPRGHAYTPENTITSKDGKRRCRACDIARKRQSG